MKDIRNKRNVKFKVGMATLAIVSATGFLASNTLLTPTNVKATETRTVPADSKVISLSSTWKYLDNNIDPANGDSSKATKWTEAGFNDSTWSSAAGKFGAKKGQLADLGGTDNVPTVLLKQYYDNANSKNVPTFFFRTTFTVTNANQVTALLGSLKADDGVIVYLNGQKIAEDNMTKGDVVAEPNMYYAGTNGGTPAVKEINLTKDMLNGILVEGQNTLAVELHNDRVSSSDIYFEFTDLTVSYKETDITQKAVSLTVGEDETENNLTWYANTSVEGDVQVAKKSAMVGDQFPASYETYHAKVKNTNDANFYSNQVTLDKLSEKTQYVYRLVNGETVSQTYTFTTGDYDGKFNFILAGDPQIGAGSQTSDIEGWNKTLETAVNAFTPNFMISAGDQVNTANNESQYTGYLNQGILSGLPSATSIGNHDSKSTAYSEHFNLPNANTGNGSTTAGEDYWYVYNNTLFMHINTNNKSVAEHKAFMEEAIKQNPNIRWKTVVYHHSVYSTASHVNDSEIVDLRKTLPIIFQELDIDVVLQGHDHVYTRTYMMNGLTPDTSSGVQSSVTDSTGILYLTANSASGSKYYDIAAPDAAYSAKMDQSERRTITNIEVTDNSYTLTTYYTDDMSVLDTFTINKTALVNQEEMVLTPDATSNSSIQVAAKVPSGALEQGTTLHVEEYTQGTTFDAVKTSLQNILGNNIKGFKILSLEALKNDTQMSLNKEIELQFDIPTGFNIENTKLYRYNSRNRSNDLEEVSYTLSNNKITVKTDQMGIFVLVETKGTTPNTDTNIKPDTTVNNTNKPSTGDNSEIGLFSMLVFGTAGCAVLTLKKKKKEQ